VIDGVGVDGTGWLMRYASKISMWWDKWVIDGLLNSSPSSRSSSVIRSGFCKLDCFPNYAMLILLGLVVLLAYYGRHMHTLLRAVH